MAASPIPMTSSGSDRSIVFSAHPSLMSSIPEGDTDDSRNCIQDCEDLAEGEDGREDDAARPYSPNCGEMVALLRRELQACTATLERLAEIYQKENGTIIEQAPFERSFERPRISVKPGRTSLLVEEHTRLSREKTQSYKLRPSWDTKRKIRRLAPVSQASTRFDFDIITKASCCRDQDPSERSEGSRSRGRFLQNIVIDPSSSAALAWNMCEIVLLSYDLITIPLLVYSLSENWWTIFTRYFSLFFWTSDVPLSCIRGYVTKGGEVQMNFARVTTHYVKTHFWHDLVLLSIEWINFALADVTTQSGLASSGRLLRFLRFSRLLKVGKMRRLVENLLARIHSNLWLTFFCLCKVMVFIFIFVHLCACGWYGISVYLGNNDSWVNDAEDFPQNYFASLLWSFTQLGFGTSVLIPESLAELIYAICSAGVCVMIASWLFSSLVILMTRLTQLQKEQRDREENMRDYLCRNKVTWSLRNRIWVLLNKTRTSPKKHLQEASVELIRQLPKSVSLELRCEVFIPVLTTHPFFCTYTFSSVNKAALHRLVEMRGLLEILLQSEHELFNIGDEAIFMYFVVQGRLSYYYENHGGPILNFLNTLENPLQTDEHPRISQRKRRRNVEDDVDIDGAITISDGHWICEQALWLEWYHCGQMSAVIPTDIVALDVSVFQAAMQVDLPEATKYAKLFLTYAKRNQDYMNDVYVHHTSIRAMAQEVFEPPVRFMVEDCTPAENEWVPGDRRQWNRVWSNCYKEEHSFSRTALFSSMTRDMKNDVILMQQTLFSSSVQNFVWHSDADRLAHYGRVNFLKRLILCAAVCGIGYTNADNNPCRRTWQYPLASVLCHGGRILFKLNSVDWREALNLILFGDSNGWNWEEDGLPEPLYHRRAATHSVRLKRAELHECKVKGSAAFSRNHFGMDVPIGGLGNPAPAHRYGNLHIGPAGVPYKKSRATATLKNNMQHGHVYIGYFNFGQTLAPVLGYQLGEKETPTTVDGSCSTGLNMGEDIIDTSFTVGGSPEEESCHQAAWGPVRGVETMDMEELSVLLKNCGQTAVADDSFVVDRLKDALETDLVFEATEEPSGKTITRLRGHLIQLQFEYHKPEGSIEYLAQTSMTGRRAGSSVSALESFPVEDDGRKMSGVSALMFEKAVSSSATKLMASDNSTTRSSLSSWEWDAAASPKKEFISIIVRHGEDLASAISRHLCKVFQLCNSAVVHVIRCHQEKPEEISLLSVDNPMSRQHAFLNVCGLTLHYHTLRIVVKITEKEERLFSCILNPSFSTTEEDHEMASCVVSRTWSWLPAKEMGECWETYPSNAQNVSEEFALKPANEDLGAILIGIECSAPFKEDVFGGIHGPSGSSKSRSAFGKAKWRDWRQGSQDIPADYGGTRIVLNPTRMQLLNQIFEEYNMKAHEGVHSLECDDKAKELFRDLLPCDDEGVRKILADRFNLHRCFPNVKRGAKLTRKPRDRSINLDGVALAECFNCLAGSRYRYLSGMGIVMSKFQSPGMETPP